MGVITKLDLMDDGTDALDVMQGKVIPLKRGFVGVVNRSQRDINERKPLQKARAAESAFFEAHHKYREISERMGSGFLASKLNELLLAHVKNSLPELNSQLTSALATRRTELRSYGEPMLDGEANRGALLLTLLTRFCTNYCEAIDGTSAMVQEAAREEGELFGGARIQHIFLSEFTESLRALDACEGLSSEDISHAIRQATGPRAPLFVPDQSFDVLARRQIALLRPHCMQVVEQVLSELQRMLPTCLPSQVARFATLRDRVLSCAEEQLHKFSAPTSKMVGSLIDMELAYLNTGHPDFIGGKQAMRMIALQLQAAELKKDKRDRSPPPQPPPPPPPSAAMPPPPPAAAVSDPLRATEGERSREFRRNGGGANGEESSSFLNTFFGSGKRGEACASTNGSAHGPAHGVLAAHGAQPKEQQELQPVGSAWPPRQQQRTAPVQMEPETEIIRTLLVSYFGIVRKNMQDLVPKAIMNFLVNAAKENMQNALVAELYKEGELEDIFAEAEHTVEARRRCAELVRALERSLEVLGELRQMRIQC